MFVMISSVATASHNKLWKEYDKCVKTAKDLSQLNSSQARPHDVGTELYKCVLPFLSHENTASATANKSTGIMDPTKTSKLVVVHQAFVITDSTYTPAN